MRHFKCKTWVAGFTVGAYYTEVHPVDGSLSAMLTNDEGELTLIGTGNLEEIKDYAAVN